MAITESFHQLAQATVSDSAGVIYTVPPNTQTIIRTMVIINPTGGSCWVKIWTNGTADGNLILPQVTLGAGEWGDDDDAITLEAGDTIQAQAETAATITFTIHGVELLTA